MGQASSKRGARGDEEQQPDVEPEGSPLAHESSPEQPASTPPDQPAPASPTIDAKVSRKPTLISFFNLSRKSTSRSPMSSTPGRRISHRPRGDDLPPDLQTGSEQLSSDYDQDSLASPRPDDDDNSSRSDDGLMNRDYLLARSSIVSRQQERQASPRSRATICAVIVCFLMLAAISAVALVLGIKLINYDIPICLHSTCIKASSDILNKLSPSYTSINPCSDFHEYVCGGWNVKEENSEDSPWSTPFSELTKRRDHLVQHILERSGSEPDKVRRNPSFELQVSQHAMLLKHEASHKLHDFYSSCMDLDSISKVGLRPMKKMIQEIAEIYPVKPRHFSDLTSSNIGLANAISFLADSGVSSLLTISTVLHQLDPTKILLQISQPSFGMPIADYNVLLADSSRRKEYEKSIADAFEQFGVPYRRSDNDSITAWNHNSRNHKYYAKQVVLFETALAGAAVASNSEASKYDPPSRTPRFWHLVHWSQIVRALPDLQLGSLIATLIPAHYEPDLVNVESTNYLLHMRKVVRDASRDTLQAYFSWRAISTYQYLVAEEYTRSRVSMFAASETIPTTSRAQECARRASQHLAPLLGHFFARADSSAKIKGLGEDIIAGVKFTLLHNLRTRLPATNESFSQVLDKLDRVAVYAGYPAAILDKNNLDSQYSSLSIDPEKYFMNTIRTREWHVHRDFHDLGKQLDLQTWPPFSQENQPFSMSPIYDPLRNVLTIPSALVHDPVFGGVKVPSFFNVAGLGFIAGSMLGHIVDDLNLTKEQSSYSSSHGPKVELPSADALGLQAAFEAWNSISEKGAKDKNLPGLDAFSKEQIFFLAYGGLWCGGNTKGLGLGFEGVEIELKGRLMGVINGSGPFKRAWNCDAGQARDHQGVALK